MSQAEDDLMLSELAQMELIYVHRGQLEMAEKMRALADEIKARVDRTNSNVIEMGQWANQHQDEHRQA